MRRAVSGQASRDGSGVLGALPLLDDAAGVVGAEGASAGTVAGRPGRSHSGRGAGTVVPGCSTADLIASTVSCASAIVFAGVGSTVFIFFTPSRPRTAATSSMKTVTMRKPGPARQTQRLDALGDRREEEVDGVEDDDGRSGEQATAHTRLLDLNRDLSLGQGDLAAD